MPQAARQWSDATTQTDNFSVIVHTQNIRTLRTHVNVENENSFCDVARMVEKETIGTTLAALRLRSGLSLRKLAIAAGYANASSIQRYFSPDYDVERLPADVAVKVADALQGKGEPPIQRYEVIALTGFPEMNATPFKKEHNLSGQRYNDVPVYGTALGVFDVGDGVAIEQTNLDVGDVITYFKRPSAMTGRKNIYGVYIQGSSMYPRYGEGESVYVDGDRPPMVGDDVVVYIATPDEHNGSRDTAALIKRLVRRTAEYIELEQFNPAQRFKIKKSCISKVHRVIPWSELFS